MVVGIISCKKKIIVSNVLIWLKSSGPKSDVDKKEIKKKTFVFLCYKRKSYYIM